MILYILQEIISVFAGNIVFIPAKFEESQLKNILINISSLNYNLITETNWNLNTVLWQSTRGILAYFASIYSLFTLL